MKSYAQCSCTCRSAQFMQLAQMIRAFSSLVEGFRIPVAAETSSKQIGTDWLPRVLGDEYAYHAKEQDQSTEHRSKFAAVDVSI